MKPYGSHPTGVRGLKSSQITGLFAGAGVAPHWGAWIEMLTVKVPIYASSVAPHWGAWIEITILIGVLQSFLVAPHWGAWIEISSSNY